MRGFAKALAIAGICLSQSAMAADWRQYAESGEAKHFYDASSLQNLRGGEVRVWTKFVPKNKYILNNNKSVDKMLFFGTYYCKYRKYDFIQHLILFKDGSTDGKIYEYNMQDVVPDTFSEKLFKIVCK